MSLARDTPSRLPAPPGAVPPEVLGASLRPWTAAGFAVALVALAAAGVAVAAGTGAVALGALAAGAAGVAAAGALTLRRIAGAERSEAALREMYEEWQDLYERAPAGYHTIAPDGRILRMNRRALDWLGYTADEVVGKKTVFDLLVPEVRARSAERLRDFLAGEELLPAEAPFLRKDGTVLPALVSTTVVRDAGGRPLRVRATLTDQTESLRIRKEIERLNGELTRSVEELEAVNRELETFSYSVSHDLRAPLRAMDGFARILVEDHGDALGAEGRRVAGVIRANAARMAQLIDDLLRFSRVSRHELVRGPVDMTALARRAAADAADGRAVAVAVAELPPAVGDGAMLRHVWANLVENAVKYSRTQAAPRVEIGARAGADGTAVYYVRDNGVGFDMRYADKLFGVFQRLHRADEFEGTGVGLAIVQRVVHRHGGRVWAESAPGAGATFSFTVPRPEE